MTAASGVVHEEFHSERFSRDGGTLEMVQLWVNLPAKEKLSPPRYQGLLAGDIPCVSLANDGGTVRVIAGAWQGVKGAARTCTAINAWDLQLAEAGDVNVEVPDGHTTLVIVQSGTVRINEQQLSGVELAVFDRSGSQVRLEAVTSARMLVLTGEPIGEPVVGQGPFVMNTREEIREAIQDYQAGLMGHLS